LIDASSIQLDEATSKSWIQVFPIGHWEHPEYGPIDVDEERAKRFTDNIKNNVRGQQLNVDYDHNTGVAAGWYTGQAELRADGVWAEVEWTPKALQHLKEKEYKYFSPDFVDEWVHPSTSTKFQDVLFGGALTNRPHLKGILPINLSEVVVSAKPQPNKQPEGGSQMDEATRKLLAETLGLPETATEAEVVKKLSESKLSVVKPEPPKPNEPKDDDPSSVPGFTVKQLREAQTSPIFGALVKTLEETNKRLESIESGSRATEASTAVKRLQEKATQAGYAIPQVDLDDLTKALSAEGVTRQLSEAIVKPYEALLDAQLKKLGEQGGGSRRLQLVGEDGNAELPATEKIGKMIEKHLSENKDLSKAEAASKVLSEISESDPALFMDYRRESYVRDVDGNIAK
jgi:phage I-like protein